MITEGQKVEIVKGWGQHLLSTVVFVFPREPGEPPEQPRRIRVVFPAFPGDIRSFRDISEADVRILPD
jgi:hypothetical protein